jgi:hypothetical protein
MRSSLSPSSPRSCGNRPPSSGREIRFVCNPWLKPTAQTCFLWSHTIFPAHWTAGNLMEDIPTGIPRRESGFSNISRSLVTPRRYLFCRSLDPRIDDPPYGPRSVDSEFANTLTGKLFYDDRSRQKIVNSNARSSSCCFSAY